MPHFIKGRILVKHKSSDRFQLEGREFA